MTDVQEPPSGGTAELCLPPHLRRLRLRRWEAAEYLAGKLASANGPTLGFTDRAIARWHALAGGWPLGLDRLGSASYMRGLALGAERIGPEVVEEAAAAFAGVAPLQELVREPGAVVATARVVQREVVRQSAAAGHVERR